MTENKTTETVAAPVSNGKEIVSKNKLMEASTYFGHKTSNWNPKMAPYIHMKKRGIHLIDIAKTQKTLEFAYQLVKKYAERNANFIFVGTPIKARATMKENALRTNSAYATERWLGGTLTNNRTIYGRVRRMEELEKLAEGGFAGYTKKEGVLLQRELDKLLKNLSGIRNMRRSPNVMIVSNPKADAIAIREARKLGVKVIGMVDSNTDPSLVDVVIPANDDSSRSINIIITILADAIAEVKNGELMYAYKKDDEIELPAEVKSPRALKKGRRFNNGPRKFDGPRKFEKRDDKKTEVKTDAPAAAKEAPAKAEAKTEEVKGDRAVIVEVNSETDYVALNDQFKKLIATISAGLVDAEFTTPEEAAAVTIDGKTVTELTTEATATIGEKISFRRAELIKKTSSQNFGAYVHANGQIASLVLIENGTPEAAKNVAMHVTAMNPQFMDEKSVPTEQLEAIKAEIAEKNDLSKKPENIRENILKGMLRKALSEITLTEQAFVMESKQSVAQYLSSQSNGIVVKTIRYEVGEGIEKNTVDFAAEVAEQMAK